MNFQTRTVLIVRFLLGRAKIDEPGECNEPSRFNEPCEINESSEINGHGGSNQQRGVNGSRGVDEKGETEIVGKIMLVNGEVKRNDGGKTRVLMVCRREDERVAALEELFGITLTEEERAGVAGRNVELLG